MTLIQLNHEHFRYGLINYHLHNTNEPEDLITPVLWFLAWLTGMILQIIN